MTLEEKKAMAEKLAVVAVPIYTWLLDHLPSQTITDMQKLDECAELAVQHAHRIWLAAHRYCA